MEHPNKQKMKLGQRRAQQVYKVKRFDENVAQKVVFFLNEIATVSYWQHPTEHTVSSQRQHDVHMMSPTKHRRLIDVEMMSSFYLDTMTSS